MITPFFYPENMGYTKLSHSYDSAVKGKGIFLVTCRFNGIQHAAFKCSITRNFRTGSL